MSDGPHIFGVRHLSPMGAWQLRRFLDEKKPRLLLIEGLADSNALIPDIVRRDTRPPIAILAYSAEPPIETLMYPLAEYSPEYQALKWAASKRVEARFIDLSSDVFLALNRLAHQRRQRSLEAEPGTETETADSLSAENGGPEPEPRFDRGSLHHHFAAQFGEPDYDTYWERHFEHNAADDSYRLAALELGRGLREFDGDSQWGQAENLVREAYMRRRIREAIDNDGIPADRIVVIVGAFHAPVLSGQEAAMSDAELAGLPRIDSHLTLMPYSYFKLSSQSGYGAGNHAPAYFQMVWHALQDGCTAELSARYLTSIVQHLRQRGSATSTAAVIEAVRLANTLSALKDGQAPALADLHDAAITLIGHGQRSTVDEAIARTDVGVAIGSLPDGVSRTSIQADFERQLRELKLEKYQSVVRKDLALDLRENRRVKTEQSAFLDLRRSRFLHQLRVLGVRFADRGSERQDSTTWGEAWLLQWSPEAEIELVESVLLGETIELAVAFRFKTRLDETSDIAEAARSVREACECGLMASMEMARRAVQRLGAGSSDFAALAEAAFEIARVARYGDVRKFDPEPLLPLLEELFVQGTLALVPASNCAADAAKRILGAIDHLNRVSQDWHERVDGPLWERELAQLSASDHLNPLLSGFACAILLERNLISNEELAREVSRRLSPGIEADLGAGWFEGLARRNRYALLSRLALWEQLADYVSSLDDEQFCRALVFLRRAFGDFSPQEKRAISENLGEIWQLGGAAVSEAIAAELSEAEEKQIEELDDFDFDDL